MIDEWVAFGIVAVICGLLAVLVRLAGAEPGSDQPADNRGATETRDDPYFGLTPLDMSRAIVACHSGPREPARPGEPARPVAVGLRRHFPELSDDARRVIAGNDSYSHAK